MLHLLLACLSTPEPEAPATPEAPPLPPPPPPPPALSLLASAADLQVALQEQGWRVAACTEHRREDASTVRCDATRDGRHAQLLLEQFPEESPWIPPPVADRRIQERWALEVLVSRQNDADTVLAALALGERIPGAELRAHLQQTGWTVDEDCSMSRRGWGCVLQGPEERAGYVELEVHPRGDTATAPGTHSGLASRHRRPGWTVTVWIPDHAVRDRLLEALASSEG